MNNQFLQHLKSITPQGKAEEKKIFIPASEFKDKKADPIEIEADEEQLDEATRSKYLKLKYGTKGPYGNKVSDETIELARKKLDAAILRRGGATPEAIKRGVAKPFGIDHEVDMAKYRFGNKKAKHLQAAINAYNKKSSRDVKEEMELDEATQSKYNKLYGRHVVGSGENKLSIARMRRAAAILRRGGADDETIRKGSDPFNIPMSHYNDVNMARYRFFNKAARSKEDGKKSPRSVKEAVSTGDPNRGRTGRAKPKLPPGLDPYDMYSKGEIRPYGGKLQKRIASMSAEDRKRYYQEIGIRSRAASRGGKTQRLFPMTEGVKRMRRLRTARFGQQGVKKELDAAYDKELSKLSASRLRRGGAPKQTVRAFFTDKPTTKAADKAYSKFSKDAMNKASAKGKKIFEAKKPIKKLKRVIKKVKRAVKGAYNILSTPQDNTDYMLTGRKF